MSTKKRRYKFLSYGQKLYKVKNYRYAHRRFYGRDISEMDKFYVARAQRRVAEKVTVQRQRKQRSNLPAVQASRSFSYPFSN